MAHLFSREPRPASAVGKGAYVSSTGQPVVGGHQGELEYLRRRGQEAVRGIAVRQPDGSRREGDLVRERRLVEGNTSEGFRDPGRDVGLERHATPFDEHT